MQSSIIEGSSSHSGVSPGRLVLAEANVIFCKVQIEKSGAISIDLSAGVDRPAPRHQCG